MRSRLLCIKPYVQRYNFNVWARFITSICFVVLFSNFSSSFVFDCPFDVYNKYSCTQNENNEHFGDISITSYREIPTSYIRSSAIPLSSVLSIYYLFVTSIYDCRFSYNGVKVLYYFSENLFFNNICQKLVKTLNKTFNVKPNF